jgi:DNA repair protein RadA/Sms
MKKPIATYVCQNCAYASPRWVGKCPNCGEWNTLIEEIAPRSGKGKRSTGSRTQSVALPLLHVPVIPEPRLPTGITEFDRVLGGGIVPGSVVLIGGDPGIGKSTLMLQVASALRDTRVLYITGEESPSQIRMRADRLHVAPSENLLLLAETNLESIESLLRQEEPACIVVDSIQTMFHPGLESAPGTVSQVREASALFIRFGKERNVPVFLVGHVTKEGIIAGPKVIEHMVDAVIQFEGERHYTYRILRAIKNRFGSTNEIGIFEMQDGGLREVTSPSEVFLAERTAGSAGSAVVASVEGTRPLLVEVQALVAPTSYGVPQRSATGFDARRLQMILAVLEKRVGLHLGQYDVFVNVAGGVRIDEPAADLGMAMAIVSSLRDIPVANESVLVGEVGLGGEIRSVHQIDKRISEAARLGFGQIVLPRRNTRSTSRPDGLMLIEVETIDEALAALIREET